MLLHQHVCRSNRNQPPAKAAIGASTASGIGSPERARCQTTSMEYRVCDHQWRNQNSNNVDDLDHGVDRGSGGVFVGIADSIAGNCRGMRLSALAAVGAILDVLLGVVPGPAA